MELNEWIEENQREISPSYQPMKGQTVIKVIPKYEFGEWAWEKSIEIERLHNVAEARKDMVLWVNEWLKRKDFEHTLPFLYIAISYLGRKEIEIRLNKLREPESKEAKE